MLKEELVAAAASALTVFHFVLFEPEVCLKLPVTSVASDVGRFRVFLLQVKSIGFRALNDLVTLQTLLFEDSRLLHWCRRRMVLLVMEF